MSLEYIIKDLNPSAYSFNVAAIYSKVELYIKVMQ